MKIPKRLRLQAKTMILLLLLTAATFLNGCSDQSPVTALNNESNISGAGGINNVKAIDSTQISLNMSLSFKSQNITDSKILESNTGYSFNHIVSVNHDVKPGEILDLQEIQPSGIFSLYLTANSTFTLTNSDGMSFCSKTILLEKCSFIDLKLRNDGARVIHVQGYVAGE
ncbi:MAG: hypothetical protein ABI462_04620 [Ignavibacteria bacterium]